MPEPIASLFWPHEPIDPPMYLALNLELPLPPRECAANDRVHHMVKAAAVQQYRYEVRTIAALAVNRSGWQAPALARLHVTWGLARSRVGDGRYRPRDADNAVGAFKAGLDGLVEAGALSGDDWSCLELGTVKALQNEGPYVRVRIEVIQPALPSPAAAAR